MASYPVPVPGSDPKVKNLGKITLIYHTHCSRTQKLKQLISDNNYNADIFRYVADTIKCTHNLHGTRPNTVFNSKHDEIEGLVMLPSIFHDDGFGHRTVYSGDEAIVWVNTHFKSRDELEEDLRYLNMAKKMIENQINAKKLEKKSRPLCSSSKHSIRLALCDDELSKIIMAERLLIESLEKVETYTSTVGVGLGSNHVVSMCDVSVDELTKSLIDAIIERGRKKHCTTIILDTDSFDHKCLTKQELFQEIIFNCRCYRCNIILLSTKMFSAPVSQRSNFDYVYLNMGTGIDLDDKNDNEKEQLNVFMKKHFGMFRDLESFIDCYNRVVTVTDDYIVARNCVHGCDKKYIIGKYRPYQL